MTAPSPRLRTAWRVGSALAAAAGSAVVTSALVNRSRNRSQRKQTRGQAGEAPAPLAGAAAAGETPVAAEGSTPPGGLVPPAAGAELLVHDPSPAAPTPEAPTPATAGRGRAGPDDLARAIEAADAVEAAPGGWARAASELRSPTTAADTGWTLSTTGLPALGEPRVPTGPPTPAAGTAAAAAAMEAPAGPEAPDASGQALSGVDTRVPRPPGQEDRLRPRRRHLGRPDDPAAARANGAEAPDPAGPPIATDHERRIGVPPGAPGPTAAGGDVTPDRRLLLFIGVAVAVAVLLGLGVVVLGGGGDGDARDEADAAPTAGDVGDGDGTQPTVPVAQLTPAQAFAQAGQRLQAAGTFAYEGTSSATDVSPVRPGPWMGVDLTVEGQVQLLTPRLFERGTAGDGTVGETVTDGVTIWGRSAPSFDALTGVSLQTLYTLPEPTPAKVGALLVPQWLTSASGATDAGDDGRGRRTFRATLPAGVLGTIEDGQAPVDAVIVLALDQDGNPAHLEVTTSSGPPLRLVYDIVGIGDDMPIQIPGETSATTSGGPSPGSASSNGSTATTTGQSPPTTATP